MKNLIKTAVIGIALTASVASCSKSETTSNNNSQTQLSANQMLLLGATNPNDANASATWHLDSSISNAGTDRTYDIDYTFRTDDSVVTYQYANNQSFTSPYYLYEDSLYMEGDGSFTGVISFPSSSQLVIDEGYDTNGIFYLTKRN